MDTFLGLLLIAVIPTAVSAGLYVLEKKTRFGKMKYAAKQTIIGVIFGLVAICATEFGVNVGGATINIRDSAPICAGLLFGAPAGIIAGVIGGVERWFAYYWGAGEYTRLACSIATVLAGIISALLRKFMFDDKKPSWKYGLALAMTMEVLHMLLIFLTNMSDVSRAFTFVKLGSLPMITVNGLTVTAATLCVTFIGKGEKRTSHELRNISAIFQRWLLACVAVCFLATVLFTWSLQTQLAETSAEELVRLNIEDVRQDVIDASDENLLSLTRIVASELSYNHSVTDEALSTWLSLYDVAEINVIGADGKIVVSSDPNNVGYDMRSGEQSAEFLALLDGNETELVQKYGPISRDASILRKYAGKTLPQGGFVQVAYDAERFRRDIDEEVVGAARNRRIGEEGYIIITDDNFVIVSDRNNGKGSNIAVTGLSLTDRTSGESFVDVVYGKYCFVDFVYSEGYYIIGAMTQSEAMLSRDISVYVTVFMEFVVFGTLFVLVYFLIKKLIVDNMDKVNLSLAEITGGNLNVVVNVRGSEEFASLSDDINSTVVTLKRYIAEAAARIDKELEFAREIQHASLPKEYPDKKELSLCAAMYTAKEVGGDFYDFFPAGDKLAFIIADVSGKGIPAALFMMTAKTFVKGFAESGNSVEDVLSRTNEKLCENNDAGMFVTAWLGEINPSTGEVEFANAGHNPPLLRKKGGKFEYLRVRPGFVLAGMEGVRYKNNLLKLEEGDELFLYTDGVTEAADTEGNLFGEERLAEFLDSYNGSYGGLIPAVKAAVDEFAGEAPQADDVTMVYLRYNGKGGDL